MATRTADTTDSRLAVDFNDAMVVVGEKFGLYTAIAELGTASEADIAGRVGVNRQQMSGWLNQQASAGYLHTDGRGHYSVSCPINRN